MLTTKDRQSRTSHSQFLSRTRDSTPCRVGLSVRWSKKFMKLQAVFVLLLLPNCPWLDCRVSGLVFSQSSHQNSQSSNQPFQAWNRKWALLDLKFALSISPLWPSILFLKLQISHIQSRTNKSPLVYFRTFSSHMHSQSYKARLRVTLTSSCPWLTCYHCKSLKEFGSWLCCHLNVDIS